ncbi:MAG: hypothetical protein HYU64_14775 [Armatimonadetes bacterium]|nr:hypothetical protein [Armatimonadota bacterium]
MGGTRLSGAILMVLLAAMPLCIASFSPSCRYSSFVSQASSSDNLNRVKTGNFTKAEIAEIKRDGYLSYYHRRKYSTMETRTAWDAVNRLFPQYSKEDRLLAVQSILAYHWVVYHTTRTHHMAANVGVTDKYREMIEELSGFHQVPASMVEGIITWENSGGIARRSYAECVGIGQLSRGAVNVAHEYYAPRVAKLRNLAGFYRKLWETSKIGILEQTWRKLEKEAEAYDVAGRHNKLKKSAKVADERVIPRCNLEDAVIYMKLLYENYGSRNDLAVSAYHNGGTNNNDIIRDYVNRNTGISLGKDAKQKEITGAISDHNIQFVHLWKDSRSRDMLNGLRTVFGEVSGPHNSGDSLGDESDIYPWKVAAAYGALLAPPETLKALIGKYEAEWDVAECRGLRIYESVEEIARARKAGRLVSLPPVVKDAGIGVLKNAPPGYRESRFKYNYLLTPEAAGFLVELSTEYRKRAGNPRLLVPLSAALESRVLEKCPPGSMQERYHSHLQGVSVNIAIEQAPHKEILRRILRELFFHDRIFIIKKQGERRYTVNPRYGKHYLGIYRDSVGRNRHRELGK